MTYVAEIVYGGTTYSVPFSDHRWCVVSGYAAPIQAWLVPESVASDLFAAIGSSTGSSREIVLRLGDPSSPVVVHRVVPLVAIPADNPQRRYLLMTDVRWYLAKQVFVMDVNVRRRLGDKRLIGDTLTSSTVVDSVAYAPKSINAGSAYKWDTLKNQTLAAVFTPARHGRPSVTFTTDSFTTTIASSPQIVQETTTDGQGDVGLARAIESIPGAGIYVALDGVVHVFDRCPGAEFAMIVGLSPPVLLDHGDIALVDKSGIRSSTWRIYVDFELEVRFTYNASGSGLWGTVNATDPLLFPVLQVTDQSLTIPAGTYPGIGTVGTRTVGCGTWITIEEAYAAWGTGAFGTTTSLPQLTDGIVARNWVGDWLRCYTIGAGGFDPEWAARITELKDAWRTYFRVNPTFWDAVRHAWAVRAAIWDPTTGTRAPSPIFANYALQPANPLDLISDSQIVNNVVDSYPSSGLLADGRPSGFTAFLEDEELGIIGVKRDLTKHPGHSALYPSPATTVPDMATADFDPGIAPLALSTADVDGVLAWKLATVLSCSPASPNDYRRLYCLVIDKSTAASAIGLSVAPDGYAPDQELRSLIGDARVAWQDDDPIPTDILGVFAAGSGGSIPDDQDSLAFAAVTGALPSPTVTPTGPVPINLHQELVELGAAVAGADLFGKLDCYQGRRAVPMDGTLVPIGTVSVVEHCVMEDRAVSVIHCAEEAHAPNPIDLMHGSARSYLLKEIATQR